jgi:demethylmenaquinone methyltransferase/2-methoxy-6-polyprenyl-1,4-benzoquinol methylase
VVTHSRSNAFARHLFEGLPARYDLLAEVLSFGQNGRWRRALVDHLLATRPERVLDAATGTAGVAVAIARRTDADIVGLDVTPAMLRQAACRTQQQGLQDRITLLAAGAERLPFGDATFDAVSFTYLLRYVAEPAATVAELARVLKPGGVMASQEFFVPPGSLWRACWRVYTRWVLPAAGWLGGPAWHDVGAFLGPNIEGHYGRYSLDWTIRAWQEAGMRSIGARTMSLGGGLVMWGRKDCG